MATRKAVLSVALALLACASPAFADIYTVDLSPYVNTGFTNSWFINGAEFAPIIGSNPGDQGVIFNVANVPDGNGGYNNFWYGLYGGPGSLTGPPGSVTIPIAQPGIQSVYVLSDTRFGFAGNTEFSVTFTFNNAGGPSVTGYYVGGVNTQDYNYNPVTDGGSGPNGINPDTWFVDASGTEWLHWYEWMLPLNQGSLYSITFNQIDGTDGAIIAGVDLADFQGAPSPEPSFYGVLAAGLAGLALARLARRRSRARE
jgi:hypothetical protein